MSRFYQLLILLLSLVAARALGAERQEGGYFPLSESKGGWRKLDGADEIRRIAGMDPQELEELRQWLLRCEKESQRSERVKPAIHNSMCGLRLIAGREVSFTEEPYVKTTSTVL